MQPPLLTTKLYVPPMRPKLVPRPRLLQRLNAGLQRKLTLVSAPAGSGKTTLLSAWINQSPIPNTQSPKFAWLSLDASDNQAARFWTYLIAALQTVHAGIGQLALKLVQSPQLPPAQAILTPLLNQIAALEQSVALILDDYHLISEQAIHEGLAFLLEHMPPSMHLALSTRSDPPLPTFRLRARHQLVELRAGDLRFSSGEAAAFLNTLMGLDLSPADVQALEARTEGWIVGLQLAALAMQGCSNTREFIAVFTGSHHYVLEYLTQEVVRCQPEPVRRFLVQTSILNRLCGPLCAALTGENDSAAMLDSLQRRNLFIVPLDNGRRWYRYQHLFADLLGNIRRQELPLERVHELHRRASQWYEQNGSLDDAVEHALRATDLEGAARLIEQVASATMLHGELKKLLRWLDALPEELLRARPRLRFCQGWALHLGGRSDLAERILQEARNALGHGPPARPSARNVRQPAPLPGRGAADGPGAGTNRPG